MIRLGIRPIKQMTATAVAIADGEAELDQRVATPAPGTEAGELGIALNQMLERLESAFDAARSPRSGCASSSPTPRTSCARRSPPSAGTPSCTASAVSADDGELDEAMRRTEQEAVRMARLVDDMLTIAKLGAGRPLDMHPVELTRLLDDAAADRPRHRPVPSDRGRARQLAGRDAATRTACAR